jgi:phosphatidylglycerol---prolipoprotein diacylglyceryl transferase
MHPILFHIPLPGRPLKLWWALVAVAVLSAIYGIWAQRRAQKQDAITGLVIAAAAGAGAYYWRAAEWTAPTGGVPIYSYGVMLGLSLVVGWYISLPLARKIGLPAETMANCYVWTALAALAGSRVLYIITNLDEFHETADYFAFRKGGLVAYGGFIGGLLGSWLFLLRHRIRLLPWADVAVPSLASGLMITRIGCYLYGCDFGQRLSSDAPGWLQKMGTFPKLPDGTLGYFENGAPIPGSPAYAHHLDQCTRGDIHYKAAECLDLKSSFPVHPTQIYESLVGLGLLVLLLWHLRHQKFRGQIFYTFVFAYGFLRFILELWRDDDQRGSLPFHTDRYLLVGGGLLAMGAAFTLGISKAIPDQRIRLGARIASFVPGVVAIFTLKTAQYVVDDYSYSTSQFIGLVSALIACFFYAQAWEEARRAPKLAMALGLEGAPEADEKELALPRKKKKPADGEESEEEVERPKKKLAGKKLKAKKKPVVEVEKEEETEDEEPKKEDKSSEDEPVKKDKDEESDKDDEDEESGKD